MPKRVELYFLDLKGKQSAWAFDGGTSWKQEEVGCNIVDLVIQDSYQNLYPECYFTQDLSKFK